MRKIFTLLAACALTSASAFAVINPEEVFLLEIPSSVDCSPRNIDIMGSHGLGAIALNIKTSSTSINRSANALVTIARDGETIGSVKPSDEGGINIMQSGILADGDVFGSTSLFILFDQGIYDQNFDPAFLKTGNYTLTIPEGTMTVNGTPVGLYTVTYHYDANPEEETFPWVSVPADGSTVSNLNEITVKFPDSRFLLYSGNGSKIYLTRPNGTKLYAGLFPALGNDDYKAEIYLKFKEATWQEGKYTLTIPKGYLCVDNQQWYEEEGTGNVQAITATYTVSNEPIDTGVEITKADGNNVIYTIEGLRVKATDVSTLPAGLYIVNGKKVAIK